MKRTFQDRFRTALVMLLVASFGVAGWCSVTVTVGRVIRVTRSMRLEVGYGGDTHEGDTHSLDVHYARHGQCESLTDTSAAAGKLSRCHEVLLALPPKGDFPEHLADAGSVIATGSEPRTSAVTPGFRGRAPPLA